MSLATVTVILPRATDKIEDPDNEAITTQIISAEAHTFNTPVVITNPEHTDSVPATEHVISNKQAHLLSCKGAVQESKTVIFNNPGSRTNRFYSSSRIKSICCRTSDNSGCSKWTSSFSCYQRTRNCSCTKYYH